MFWSALAEKISPLRADIFFQSYYCYGLRAVSELMCVSLNCGKILEIKMNDLSEANYRVTADELRQFIERFERLEIEKKDIADQQKEVMAEAKGRGYDTKIMRKIVALRKRDQSDIAEEEAVLDMYKEALGM